MRVHQQIKETYEQVGEYEYNEINPYVHAVGWVRHKYPNAKIRRTKTMYDSIKASKEGVDKGEPKKTTFGSVEFPILQVFFEVD